GKPFPPSISIPLTNNIKSLQRQYDVAGFLFEAKINGALTISTSITRFKLTRLGGDLVVCIEANRTARQFFPKSRVLQTFS
ncbi:MAG: hypothetical protein ACREOO_11785, partial [bacterium]